MAIISSVSLLGDKHLPLFFTWTDYQTLLPLYIVQFVSVLLKLASAEMVQVRSDQNRTVCYCYSFEPDEDR